MDHICTRFSTLPVSACDADFCPELSLWSKGRRPWRLQTRRMARPYHPGYAGTDSVGNPLISSVELGQMRPAVAPRHGSTEQVQGLWQNDQRYSITDLQKMAGSGQPFAKYSPQGVARTILPPPANRWKPRSGIGFAVWASDIKRTNHDKRLAGHEQLSRTNPGRRGYGIP